MAKVIFLGVGEAFDELHHNTSILLEHDSHLLLDCGFFAIRQLWKYTQDQNYLDAIYLSHFHADHYFGLPALLMRMKEEKRKSPLTLITQRGGKSKINAVLSLAYKTTLASFGFKINILEVKHGMQTKVNEFKVSFGRTIHAIPNLAIRIGVGEKTLVYSGDGQFFKNHGNFYQGADVLIHDAYTLKKPNPYHATVEAILAYAKEMDIKRLALVHLHRQEREKAKDYLEKIKDSLPYKVVIPKEMQELEL
ncbi:MAG: ribonuclease Z [Candidatus Woesearchaeota archaeon]